MEEKKKTFTLKDWMRDYWIYIVIYGFFLYVSSTSVRAGDDWEVQNWYNFNLLTKFLEAIRALFYFNGRLANNIATPFFGYYDFIWRFTAPAVFTSIIYLSNKLFGNARKLAPVGISFLLLLLVSDDIRLQTYTNLTNNVGYIFVIGLIFLYLNIIFNENADKRLRFWQHEKLNYLSVTLLAFIIGLWIENTTIGFVAANILLALISYIKFRKISPYICCGLAGCLLSCLVMFGTPGYFLRFSAMGGGKVGITQRVIQNLPNILQQLVLDNLPIYLVFLIVFIASTLARQISTKGDVARVVAVVFASAMAMIISVRMFLNLLADNYFTIHYPWVGTVLYFINDTFFDVNKLIPVIFYFLILLFVLITVFLSQQKEKLLVLFSIGLVSAGVMAGSPYSGGRTFMLAICVLMSITAYISSTIKINSGDLRKASLLALILATLLQMDKFIFYGTYAMQTETIRVQLIDSYRTRIANGINAENEWLILPAYKKGSVLYTSNPAVNNMAAFKRYHHLPNDAKVIIDDVFAVKSFSAKQVNGTFYRFEVIPLYNVSQYTYTFFVRQNGIAIYKSVEKTDNFDNYEFPDAGTYTITCMLSHKTNGQKEVAAFEPVIIKAK